MAQLHPDVIEALERLEFSDDGLACKLAEQYDKELFAKIRKVFEVYGVKYKGKAFRFPFDFRPIVAEIVETGEAPEKKNPTAFFPTPAFVVESILSMPDFDRLMYSPYDYFSEEEAAEMGIEPLRILEPSAGQGAIADLIRERMGRGARLDVVEYFHANAAILERKGYSPIRMDFMEYNADGAIKYDFIVMNPPFSLKGQKHAYIDHVMHAWSMLKEGGTLAAVLPTGFMVNRSRTEREFLETVCRYGEIVEIHDEAFKDVGTKIKTVTIVMKKSDWKEKPTQGHANWFQWHFGLLAGDTMPQPSPVYLDLVGEKRSMTYAVSRERELSRIAKILADGGIEKARDRAEAFVRRVVDGVLSREYIFLPMEHKELYMEVVAGDIRDRLVCEHGKEEEEADCLAAALLGKKAEAESVAQEGPDSIERDVSSIVEVGGLFEFAA